MSEVSAAYSFHWYYTTNIKDFKSDKRSDQKVPVNLNTCFKIVHINILKIYMIIKDFTLTGMKRNHEN